MEDEKIVALYWSRDEAAIGKTQEKYGRYCRTIAVNILGSDADADEVLNDTWLAAWNSIPPHKPAKLATYLGKLTRRTALKKWRSANTAKRGSGQLDLVLDELEEVISTAKSVDEELMAEELSAALGRFVMTLGDTERRVFLRRYWYMESVDQICFAFSFTPGKVHSILHRTRNKLRSYLKKEGYL